MKKLTIWLLIFSFILGMEYPSTAVYAQSDNTVQTAENTNGRTVLNMNSDWGFYRGDLAGSEAIDFDDQAFANITVPHTMRLEKKHANGGQAVYQGIGWYRHYFTVYEMYRGNTINIDFEGVMTDSEIYLNGEKIYSRNGGYVGFSVDITDKVKFGETNVLAVKVSSYDSPDTPPGKPVANLDFHYYGGIYRDVTMRITNNLHISDALQADKTASGGVFATYPEVSKTSAKVNVKTHVVNKNNTSADTKVVSKIVEKEGNIVAQGDADGASIPAGGDKQFNQDLTITNPNLWHPDTPYLYSLVSEVYNGSTLVDSVTTKIGIRTIEYKADGFYINGERLYIRGANRHQAYQNIGDAAPNSMQYRDAMQIKENGFNAVRATHYPNDPAFLDAADELGLLVIECQPGWQNFTKSQKFYDLTLRDTREMIRRDRNRPSVILWETSLNETGYSAAWAKEVTAIAHTEYPGNQMYTAADHGLQGSFYDVNYKVVDTNWEDDPSKWTDFVPNKPFFTREWGDFEESSKALRKEGEDAMMTQILTRQRYLNGDGYSDWGGLDANDRIGGYFLWSWNDYARGSTTKTLGSGTVDIDRYEKYDYYWLQSMQSARNSIVGPMVFIASTYSPTSSLNINVFSNSDSVKLYQNNVLVKELTREEALKSVPNIAKKGGSPIFTFTLDKFAAGELRAEAILDGKVVKTHTVRTPGQAAGIEIEVRDRGIVPVADGSDLIPVYFKVVDANGTVVPNYEGKIQIAVTGEGELVGKNIERIGVEEQSVEGGIGFAFVRTTDVSGSINIHATAEGLNEGSKIVSTVPYKGQFVPDGQHTPWVGGVDKLETTEQAYKNIAIGKPVTSSSEQSGNFAKNAVDDDEGTRWCASGGSLPQWIQVDLQKSSAIAGFQVIWESSTNVYKYDIEVSEDGNNWQKVVDNTLNTTPNGHEETKLVETKGRYVRLTIVDRITNGDWASLYEFKIIPLENEEPGDRITDAKIESITSSSESEADRGTGKLRDGVTTIGTGWLSKELTLPQSITVKFNKPQSVVGSRIFWEKDSNWYTYDLEVSTDGHTWQKALDNRYVGGQHFTPETFAKPYDNINYVRVTIKDIIAGGGFRIGMAELILYGQDYEEPEPKNFDYASDLEWVSAHSDYNAVLKDEPQHGGSNLDLNTEAGVQTFTKGLSSDTNSEVVYNVDGRKYTRFQAYAGIDKKAPKMGGEAIFKVFKDDELIYTSPVKMRDDNCEFIDLDITGAKQIKLVAEWHNNPENPESRYNTHVDWADAKLIHDVTVPTKTGTIAGTVTTGENALLEGVKVSLTVGEAVYAATTSAEGIYAIINVPVGTGYTVTASVYGYTEQSKSADVIANETTTLDFNLEATTTTDTTAPTWSADAKLSASNVGKTSLKLSWTAASDDTAVTSYKVYKNGNVLAILAGDMISYNVTGLGSDTTYNFKVEAGDAAGNWSVDGPSVRITTEANSSDSGWTPSPDPKPMPTPTPKPIEPTKPVKPTKPVVPKVEFTDIADHWVKASIEKSVELGFVRGYEDGTFRPNRTVTRGEIAAMLAKALKLETTDTEFSFDDKDETPVWAQPFIQAIAKAGYISGYEDGTFHANNEITRSEIVVIIVRALGLEVDSNAQLTFNDAEQVPVWARPYIAAAVEAGLVKGNGDGKFNPNGPTTRAEAITLILGMLSHLK
ncbi:glycoside hydrolase family 2 [Paenibacillus wynnii]|uniref:glycoside hydrolase family 2 n=1 Tax=Paenibacillus wynnii TaxID=268407 RepID=UPI00068EBC53|nr:glycoside hydrolase family 2 [Paenibacillus wynnii]